MNNFTKHSPAGECSVKFFNFKNNENIFGYPQNKETKAMLSIKRKTTQHY